MKRTGRIVLGMLLAIGLFLADQPQSRAEATGNPRPAVVSPQSLLLVVGLDEASLAMSTGWVRRISCSFSPDSADRKSVV